MGIFRKQMFRCAGCGATKQAKMTVPAHQATLPVGAPPGWGRVDIIAQHPDTGGIGSLTVFVCGEGCFKTVTEGGGEGQPYIARFKAAFAPVAPGVVVTDVEDGPMDAPAVPDDGTPT